MLEIVFPSVYNLWIGRTGKAGSFRQRWDDNPWKKFFDVIDLDPYGSAIPFIESALGAL